MNGAFNDASFSLDRSASEREVIDEVDRILRPYGGYGAYGRKNQVSHTFISDEVRQNRVFGLIVPAIFLGLAAFLISTVYKQFYHFPALRFSLQPATLLLTYAVVASTAAVGCLGAVRRVVLLPPAEAMRPQAPVGFRAGLLERLGMVRWISFNGRMVIRNIGRYPVKAALSILGIALGTAVLLVGYYFQDALHYGESSISSCAA